jgi:hypothetical protein
VVYSIINRLSTIPGGAGFLPSTVYLHHQPIREIGGMFTTERFSEELGTTWHHLIVIDGIVTWMFIYTFFDIATILISIGVAF